VTTEPVPRPFSYRDQVPDEVSARHRAGGLGRLITVRSATPRHAAPGPTPGATGRTALRPWALLALVLLLLAVAVPVSVFTLRRSDAPRAAVPLPLVSFAPRPATSGSPSPTATRRALRALPRAAKATIALTPSPTSPAATSRPASAPARAVLLGPAADGDLPALLSSYCQATQGQFTLAMSTRTGWVCAGFGRPAGPIDMGAMCRWRYGDRARAEQGDPADPRSWRCYRDGP
jgi:hypothetical protein